MEESQSICVSGCRDTRHRIGDDIPDLRSWGSGYLRWVDPRSEDHRSVGV